MGELWQRQPWDTPASFNAFHVYYLSQAPPRSVNRAYQARYANRHGLDPGNPQVTTKVAPGTWRNWSQGKKWDGSDHPTDLVVQTWQQRAVAWDNHNADLDAAQWQARRQETREKGYTEGVKLLGVALRWADLLKQWRESETERWEIDAAGQRYKVVEKTLAPNVTLAHLAQATKTAVALMREAAEVPDPITRVAPVTPEGEPLVDAIANAQKRLLAAIEGQMAKTHPPGQAGGGGRPIAP